MQINYGIFKKKREKHDSLNKFRSSLKIFSAIIEQLPSKQK